MINIHDHWEKKESAWKRQVHPLALHCGTYMLVQTGKQSHMMSDTQIVVSFKVYWIWSQLLSPKTPPLTPHPNPPDRSWILDFYYWCHLFKGTEYADLTLSFWVWSPSNLFCDLSSFHLTRLTPGTPSSSSSSRSSSSLSYPCTFHFLRHFEWRSPHITLDHLHTSDSGVPRHRAPLHTSRFLHTLSKTVPCTHEAQSVDEAVAHGDALDDVEGDQWIALSCDHRRVKIPQKSKAIIRSPAKHVSHEDGNQSNDGASPSPQTPLELLGWKPWNVLEPELTWDPGVAGCHDCHGSHKLHNQNEHKVRAVEKLLVCWPDLCAEDLAAMCNSTLRVLMLCGEVRWGHGNEDREDPDSEYKPVSGLILHSWLQRMHDGHVSRKHTHTHTEAPLEILITPDSHLRKAFNIHTNKESRAFWTMNSIDSCLRKGEHRTTTEEMLFRWWINLHTTVTMRRAMSWGEGGGTSGCRGAKGWEGR